MTTIRIPRDFKEFLKLLAAHNARFLLIGGYAVNAFGYVRNTVDMDVERVKFIESTLRYEYSVDRVKGHYKDIEDLLKGTPY